MQDVIKEIKNMNSNALHTWWEREHCWHGVIAIHGNWSGKCVRGSGKIKGFVGPSEEDLIFNGAFKTGVYNPINQLEKVGDEIVL